MTKLAYIDLQKREFDLSKLDDAERSLVAELQGEAAEKSDWYVFGNSWLSRVANFYDRRGVSREEMIRSVPYRIGQDLSSRLAVAQGYARVPDYREEIGEIIRTRFKTHRAFCEATGLSEDMLSHVLAGRKDLSLEALSKAMSRIGYVLRLMPLQSVANGNVA